VVDRATDAIAQEAARRVTEQLGVEEDPVDLADDVARDAIRALDSDRTARFRLKCIRPQENAGIVSYLTADELDPVALAERYPPGDYLIRGLRADGTWINGTHARLTISRLARRESEPRAGGSSGQTSLLRELLEAQDRRERERATDNREFWKALAAPLATVAAAWVGRAPAGQIDTVALITALNAGGKGNGSMVETVQALQALEELRRGRGDQSTAVLDGAFKLMDKLKDLPASTEGAGASPGEWGWLKDVLREVGPVLAAALAQRRGSQAPAQFPAGAHAMVPPRVVPATMPPRPLVLQPLPGSSSGPQPSSSGTSAQAGTTPSAPPEQPPSPPSSSVPPAPDSVASPGAFASNGNAMVNDTELDASQRAMLAIAMPWLHQQAANLVVWAASDVDTRMAADMLTASLPALFTEHVPPEQFLAWLNRQDWWTQLVEFEPQVTPYQSWCARVRTELVTWFEEERELEEREARSNGEDEDGTATSAG
jgi:hypothetical protein